jgi:hypothetical protein
MKKLILILIVCIGMFVLSCTEKERLTPFNEERNLSLNKLPGMYYSLYGVNPTFYYTDSIPTGLDCLKSNRSTTTITLTCPAFSRGKGVPAPPWNVLHKVFLVAETPPPTYPTIYPQLQYGQYYTDNTNSFSTTLTIDNDYLKPDVLYYVRSVATQSRWFSPTECHVFVGYSEIESFYFNKPYVIGMNKTNITALTCTLQSYFDDQGASTITAIGFCWGTASNPTTSGTHSSCTIQSGDDWYFTSNVTGLTPNTLYYVRTYTINSQGTFYGSQQTFTTLPCPHFNLTSGFITVSPTTLENHVATNVNASITGDLSGTTITRATAYKDHLTGTITTSNWNGTNPCWSALNLSVTPGGYSGAYFTQQMTITKSGCTTDIKTAKVFVNPSAK